MFSPVSPLQVRKPVFPLFLRLDGLNGVYRKEVFSVLRELSQLAPVVGLDTLVVAETVDVSQEKSGKRKTFRMLLSLPFS